MGSDLLQKLSDPAQTRRRVDWYVVIPVFGPVLLWMLGGQDFTFDAPHYVDTFGVLGRFWHYAEQNPSFEAYKTSRLPWILPGFVLHHLFATVTAEQILHMATLVASSIGLYFLLRDSLKDRMAAAAASAAWSCYTWIHGDGGWNYQVAGASAYHVWGLWALVRWVTAPVSRRPAWALAAGALLASAVHTHMMIALFVPIAALLFAATPGDSLRATFERTRSGMVWGLVGAVAVTTLLALINVAFGGRWMFFVPQVQEVLLRAAENRFFQEPAAWIYSAGHLVIPVLIVAAGVLWMFTARRRQVGGQPARRFPIVFVLQGLMAFGLMLFLQFAARQTALDPTFFAYPLYTQVFPILGVVLASWRADDRPSAWLACAVPLAIVAPLLLLFPATMPSYVARMGTWLSVPSSMSQLVPLTIGGVAILAMAWQGQRLRILTFAAVYGLLNAWVCPFPNQYGIGTPGINGDNLAVITSLDHFTAKLDPTLFGIRYWRERDVVQWSGGPIDLYYVFESFLSTRRRSLLTVAYDRQPVSIAELELRDLYGQRCLGVFSAKDKHDAVVARMTRHFQQAGAPLAKIGQHEVASGPISVALTVLMVPTAGPCVACAPTDADIQRDVEQRIAGDRSTRNRGLSVRVNGCVVSLNGGADSQREQEQALTLARSARGVVRVDNEIFLRNVNLEQKVRAALAADPLVGQIPIRVDVFGGEVRLTSEQTNQSDRTRAISVAASVAGVFHVEDHMK